MDTIEDARSRLAGAERAIQRFEKTGKRVRLMEAISQCASAIEAIASTPRRDNEPRAGG